MKYLLVKSFIYCTFAGTLLISACNSGEKTEDTSTENAATENTVTESPSAENTTPQSSAAQMPTTDNAASTATAGNINLETGKKLYSTNCAVCHQLSKDVLIGPGLAGITERRTQEWLVPWIKNSQKMIESGDKYGVELFNKYNKVPMPAYENFSDDEIKSILAYIEQNQVK